MISNGWNVEQTRSRDCWRESMICENVFLVLTFEIVKLLFVMLIDRDSIYCLGKLNWKKVNTFMRE